MFILFTISDTAILGFAIKQVTAQRHVFINKVTKLPRAVSYYCIRRIFFFNETSYLLDVISLF